MWCTACLWRDAAGSGGAPAELPAVYLDVGVPVRGHDGACGVGVGRADQHGAHCHRRYATRSSVVWRLVMWPLWRSSIRRPMQSSRPAWAVGSSAR